MERGHEVGLNLSILLIEWLRFINGAFFIEEHHMNNIQKAIDNNRQKLTYLDSYLTVNEVAMERILESNISAVKELINKKQAIITSINVLDDRIISDINNIKEFYSVEDLSELSAKEYPKLWELKEIATDVLRKMVDVKNSDQVLFEKMEDVFEDYKNEKGKFDRTKLEAYTNNFFNE